MPVWRFPDNSDRGRPGVSCGSRSVAIDNQYLRKIIRDFVEVEATQSTSALRVREVEERAGPFAT
jgi:hypothetical protein